VSADKDLTENQRDGEPRKEERGSEERAIKGEKARRRRRKRKRRRRRRRSH